MDLRIKHYLKLLRVHHYVKNVLVFSGLIFSGKLFETIMLKNVILGFVSFCLISSSVYIINDIQDVEKDRKHPQKCKRPIASGAVSVKAAVIITVACLTAATTINLFAFSLAALLLQALYLAVNIAYSFGLKNIPLIDVAVLVFGFLIRVYYGAYICGTAVSNWLYLTVIAGGFYFALGKRRNEAYRIGNEETRKVLKYYTTAFLDKNMYMCLALANTFYALWCMDRKTSQQYGFNMMLSVPVVLLITMKYSLDVEGESDGDPVEVLLHDKMLLALCVFYAIIMFIFLYVK